MIQGTIFLNIDNIVNLELKMVAAAILDFEKLTIDF